MKIYLASDHNGFSLKGYLKRYLVIKGYDIEDLGNLKLDENDDFPDYADNVASAIQLNKEGRGILICGSGIGMCISANRYSGIRAVNGYNKQLIVDGRNDNNTNVLCLGAKYIQNKESVDLVETFLNSPYLGSERFERRIKKLDLLK